MSVVIATHDPAEGPAPPPDAAGDRDEARLFAWVEAIVGGTVRASTQTWGGNLARSWAIDV